METFGQKIKRLRKARSVFTITANGLKGTYMLLDEASVTGTANIIMAAGRGRIGFIGEKSSAKFSRHHRRRQTGGRFLARLPETKRDSARHFGKND